MSLDIFSFNESGESYDPAAFERFKEQIKQNAPFIAALKKAEGRQKKQEDTLLKILMQFFQKQQNQGIVLLAARLLEQNIPASFVLAVILLGNDELAEEAKPHLRLQASKNPAAPSPEISQKTFATTEFSLMPRMEDPSIPLKVKAEIDAWGKNLYQVSSVQPFRLLETVLDKNGSIKKIVIDCMANVLQSFLEKHGLPKVSYDTTFSFCEFLIHGIMQLVKKQIENQKLVGGNASHEEAFDDVFHEGLQ